MEKKSLPLLVPVPVFLKKPQETLFTAATGEFCNCSSNPTGKRQMLKQGACTQLGGLKSEHPALSGVLCTRAVLAKCVVGEGSFEITDSVLASPRL